jgi:methionyl-tRNA formyltransferase
MDPGFDTGPILAQERVPVAPEDTTGSLTTKLSEVGAKLLVSTLTDWVEGKLSPRQQSAEGANYTTKITKKDGEIDWHLSATDIWRRVRAFQPWPGCHTWWHGKMLRIIETSPLVGAQMGQPGLVVSVKRPGGVSIGVQTGDGLLALIKVQPEGKRPMMAEEFGRGQRSFVGAVLPC